MFTRVMKEALIKYLTLHAVWMAYYWLSAHVHVFMKNDIDLLIAMLLLLPSSAQPKISKDLVKIGIMYTYFS